MTQIGEDYEFNHKVVYRKCPMCSDRMSHINFAGRSGVIIDRCGTHGIWLEGGEVRRLTEWWRTGGKLVFQQYEADKTKRLYQENDTRETHPCGTIESIPESAETIPTWLTILAAAGSVIVD